MPWREYVRILFIGLLAILMVIVGLGIVYSYSEKKEEKLIHERKAICEQYAEKIAREVERSEDLENQIGTFSQGDTIYLALSRKLEEELTGVVMELVSEVEGLEGGFYLLGLHDFIGYAYPTSEPPIPEFGPPPRSYNIIKEQVLESINGDEPILNLHAFDPAVFPLATCPIHAMDQVAGAVWVRIHVERELPVARLRQVLNFGTLLLLMGFVVMALFSLFMRNGISSIRKELENTRKDPSYRLHLRGGLFGFIPRSINEMLDLIDNEYHQRLELEKELHHKERLASLGRMIAGVAHEVKTPLAVIKTRMQMWQSEIARNKELEASIDTESIKMVVDEINRVSELMKRLVLFSRPVNDNLVPVRVEELLEEVIGIMEFRLDGKNIRFEKSLQEGVYRVNLDINSFKQVLINIYMNSIESMGDEGTIITETHYPPHREEIIIKIRDTGTGLPNVQPDKIFEPFFTTKDTGAGLGLAISQQIIMNHDGTITFRNNTPSGTTCIITLPLTIKPQ